MRGSECRLLAVHAEAGPGDTHLETTAKSPVGSVLKTLDSSSFRQLSVLLAMNTRNGRIQATRFLVTLPRMEMDQKKKKAS